MPGTSKLAMKVQVYSYIAEHGAGLLFKPVEGSNPGTLSDIEPQLAFLGEYDLPEALLKAIGEDDIHPGCYGAIYVEK
jgi:hypothetical protein